MWSAGSTPPEPKSGTLSLDKAAFLLIRLKRAFHKKKTKGQVSERASCSSAAGGSGPGGVPPSAPGRRKPAPLLRARTLPAIVTPSLCIIQAQLDAGQQQGTAMTQHRQPRHAKKKQQADSCKGSPDKADASPPSARLLARRSPSGGTLRARSTQGTSARKWHIIQEKNK